MANLATALRYYVYDKMNTDPAWQGIKVLSFVDNLLCLVCCLDVTWRDELLHMV